MVREQVHLCERRSTGRVLLQAIWLSIKVPALIILISLWQQQVLRPNFVWSLIAVPLTLELDYVPGYADTIFRICLTDIFLRDISLVFSCFLALSRTSDRQLKHILLQLTLERVSSLYRSTCTLILWGALMLSSSSPVPVTPKTRMVLSMLFILFRLPDWLWRIAKLLWILTVALTPPPQSSGAKGAPIWRNATSEQISKADTCSICDNSFVKKAPDATTSSATTNSPSAARPSSSSSNPIRTPSSIEASSSVPTASSSTAAASSFITDDDGTVENNGFPVSLHCGHLFHEKCIAMWVVRNNTCPMCRANVIQGDALARRTIKENVDQFIEFNPLMEMTGEYW